MTKASGLPRHVYPRYDHPVYARLQEVFGPAVELMWNARLERFEVWTFGMFHERVVAPGGSGFAEPGDWLINRMRAEDPRYNTDLDDVVRRVTAPVEEHNDAIRAASEKKMADTAAEIAGTYAPIFQREMLDDPIIAKPFTHGERKT